MEKREEAAISVASTVSDLRVIQKAQANYTPVSPKKKLVYSLTTLLALVAPFIIILLKEQLNTTIQFRSDIEARVRIPIIGEIVLDNAESGLIKMKDCFRFL